MEKIALNRAEKYLTSQPRHTNFSDSRVRQAFKNIQFSMANKRIANAMSELGATDLGIAKHLNEADAGIRKNRRNKGPFQPTRDVLAKNKNPKVRQAKLNEFKMMKKYRLEQASKPVITKSNLLKRTLSLVKKHPVASAATIGTGAVIGYGLKKDNEF